MNLIGRQTSYHSPGTCLLKLWYSGTVTEITEITRIEPWRSSSLAANPHRSKSRNANVNPNWPPRRFNLHMLNMLNMLNGLQWTSTVLTTLEFCSPQLARRGHLCARGVWSSWSDELLGLFAWHGMNTQADRKRYEKMENILISEKDLQVQGQVLCKVWNPRSVGALGAMSANSVLEPWRIWKDDNITTTLRSTCSFPHAHAWPRTGCLSVTESGWLLYRYPSGIFRLICDAARNSFISLDLRTRAPCAQMCEERDSQHPHHAAASERWLVKKSVLAVLFCMRFFFLITSFFRRQHVVFSNLENTWEHEMFRRCRNSSVVTSPRLRLTRPTHGSSPQAVSTRTTFDTSWREMISDLVVVSFIASPGQVPHRVTESVRALGTWSLGEMVSERRDCVLGCALKCSTLFRSGMLCHVVPCCLATDLRCWATQWSDKPLHPLWCAQSVTIHTPHKQEPSQTFQKTSCLSLLNLLCPVAYQGFSNCSRNLRLGGPGLAQE